LTIKLPITSCIEERKTTSVENNNLKKVLIAPSCPIGGARRTELMGKNESLIKLIIFVQKAQICTLVIPSSSSPAQDLCAYFPQCPQPTQISVDTEYNSLQTKHAVQIRLLGPTAV
jgi:hypothetical protein